QHVVSFQSGEIIFREGDDPDAAWLLVGGEVSVYNESNPENPIALLGAGQCFGERACLDNNKRNATVKALSAVEAIKISRDHFVKLHQISDELKNIISGLNFLYSLNQRGLALQYFSNKHGETSIERLYRLNNGQQFISSWMPVSQIFKLDRIDDIKTINNFIDAKWIEPTHEELKNERTIRLLEGKIHNLSVFGEWPELSNLIAAAIDGHIIEKTALLAFEKSGRLEVKLPEKTDVEVCFCLGISASTIQSHIDSGCDSFESLRDKIGCGSVCGGCEPQIQAMLGRAEWIPITAQSHELADGVRSFVLKPSILADLEWKTGQFIVISGRIGGHWVNRSYTIVSAPNAGAPLEVAIKREPKGLFSKWLFDGDLSEKELRISLPRGNSIWVPSERPTVCLVAGIGITPAIAILRA
ncbi:MAG: cyclic nucleotide-binding domain-containing protein, partial [Methylocystis sp.]